MYRKLNLIAFILVSYICIFPVKLNIYKSGPCRDVLYNADCDPDEVCDAKSWSCKKEKEGNSEHGTNSITNPTSIVNSFRKEMQRQYRLQT